SVPLVFDPDVVQKLTTLLILMLLAVMWNALAGYGGLLSVGQQAFIGIGAYGTVFFADQGVSPYVAMLLATLLAGLISVPISLFALRLRAAQFAIGMWVIAEVISIIVRLDQNLGAGTGISLIQLNQYEPGSIFSVQWSAYMIFMVLVGGLGTFEGPILGAVLLFAIQTTFTQGGPWYLVGLGATAALFALVLPRGLWGTVEERLGLRLLPVGYRVVKTKGEERAA